MSEDQLKLTAGGIDARGGAHRVVLADISFDSQRVYWEVIINELVSETLTKNSTLTRITFFSLRTLNISRSLYMWVYVREKLHSI